MSLMKRIRYASRFCKSLTPADIAKLVEAAAANNAESEITGLLFATGDMFFQLIEGPADAIDALFAQIHADRRHTDIVVLEHETAEDLTRICPDWSMRRIDLSSTAVREYAPLRTTLTAIHSLTAQANALRANLEDAVWQLLLDSELQD